MGKPNVGKSTLMNRLIGENLSIITAKAQTTRNRIMGILSDEHWQIVYSDTPGILEPKYELHKAMMKYVASALEDADVVLLVVDAADHRASDLEALKRLASIDVPVIGVLNKIDLCEQSSLPALAASLKEAIPGIVVVIGISALNNFNVESIKEEILNHLPEHPPYFEADELTDKTERFLAAELIREKIYIRYSEEIPYACQVIVTDFKETDGLIKVYADILVERESQKGILIGKDGHALKHMGVDARKALQSFFGKKVYLETHVKVEPDWRKNDYKLARLGFN